MSNQINKNMKLWQQVETTNPAHTKKAQKGAHHFTSITPMSQFKAATQAFGIQGIHWGIKIGSETFTEHDIGETKLLDYDAILYFVFEGARGEIPVHATEKLAYKTQGVKGYLKVDDEARKKVVTNAKTKGLSELGFNADIFMGMFDDVDYFAEINIKSNNVKQNAKEEKIAAAIDELKEYVNLTMNKLGESENIATLTLMYSQYEKKTKRMCQEAKQDPTPYIQQYIEICKTTKAALQPKESK